MKSLRWDVLGIIISFTLVLPLSINASDQNTKNNSGNVQEKDGTKPEKPQPLPKKLINNVPIYKPPLRGAPAGRVAAGTRGADPEIPYLCLIVPDHVGLTISSHPTLYYYQSKASSFPVEFTLIEKQGITPVIETRITPSQPSGIQAIRLKDYDVHLEPGVQYKWFIALVADPRHRSKDVLAAGGIERIPDPENIKNKLAGADMSQAPHLYDETGLWYDAFDSLSLLIQASPRDNGLKRQRSALLEQIGLTQVAARDMTK